MLNLIAIVLLFVAPILSIAAGILFFGALPLGLAVALTILLLLIFFLGGVSLASFLLVKVRAPHKAADFDAALLSKPSASNSAFTPPGAPDVLSLSSSYVFALGVTGHLACLGTIAVAVLPVWDSELTTITVVRVFIAIAAFWALLRNSKLSSLFAPPLIASPEGILSRKNFVPWSDVMGVTAPGRGRVRIQTLKGASAYLIAGDGGSQPFEGTYAYIPSIGMWPEDLAQYLSARARLSRSLTTN